MSHRRWLLALILVALIAGAWWARQRRALYPDAYIADQSATLWSATAQVRRQVATLGYGEKVSVLGRASELTEVRAADGTHGWVDSRLLMVPALWNRVGQLLSDARNLPVQAKGRTRTISNVHIDPGRDSPRIFQFGRDVPVAVLRREVAAVPASGSGASDDSTPAAAEKSDAEDWLLALYSPANARSGPPSARARSDVGPAIPIAGWVLSRFVELDPPPPVGDYTAASGRRVVAWAQLNTVQDSSGEKPQYVVAATRGGEGQPCDFTSLRVYAWGAGRRQYETSYLENNLCGRLPVRVSQTPAGPEFGFTDERDVEHVYRLVQTVVRRIAPLQAGRRSR